VPAQGQAGATILLVEDEAPVRRLGRRVLESSGYVVLEAASGEEGLRIAIDHDGALDLVLTDVVMPGLSGAEMVRRLQRYRSDFATMYCSGYTDEAVARHGVLTPDKNFLQKPFTPEHLLAAVRRVLSSPEI
jgi:CheY-like chemotaxis protein